jgi:hypothetical protein
MAPEDPNRHYPLYNTTFSLHRVSPLFTRANVPLTSVTLQQHARRFRDILAGEVLRGVRVGLAREDDMLARVGALQTVIWRILPEEEAWNGEDETQMEEIPAMSLAVSRGMLVTITYEKMAYKAILLRENLASGEDTTMMDAGEAEDGFQRFPLLLTRMPSSLRDVFVDFLTTTFDCRVFGLHLTSQYLVGTFEKYVADLSVGEDGDVLDLGQSSRILRPIIKETVVFIGFDIPNASGSLKTIDIQIAREDLPRMIATGKPLDGESPFFDALASYVKTHLALNLWNEKVKIVRIACGAFVIGEEGKLKLTRPSTADDGHNSHSQATRRLVNDLVKAAGGEVISSKAV